MSLFYATTRFRAIGHARCSSQPQLPESDDPSSDHLDRQLVPVQQLHSKERVGLGDINQSPTTTSCPIDRRLVNVEQRLATIGKNCASPHEKRQTKVGGHLGWK